MDELLRALEHGHTFRFSGWPNRSIPLVAAGVYTIWDQNRFIYVGMAGRSLSASTIAALRTGGKKCTGLFDRLASHASGRRSGDQFCVYVADRLVLPCLTKAQIAAIAEGKLKMDALVRHFIHEQLSYRHVETGESDTAREIESWIRRNGLSGVRPLLNP